MAGARKKILFFFFFFLLQTIFLHHDVHKLNLFCMYQHVSKKQNSHSILQMRNTVSFSITLVI